MLFQIEKGFNKSNPKHIRMCFDEHGHSSSQSTSVEGQTVHYSIDSFARTNNQSELITSETFVFIGMEFLTQDRIVRVPLDKIQNILTWFLN